jgi:LmbE family N-acetylglucosaminyl deacetylase
MTERVLCVAAHPDDESLGCGATLAKHAAAGDHIAIVIFADGLASRGGVNSENIKLRHGMARRACKTLGTDDVYLHQYADNMMDNVPILDVIRQVEVHVNRVKPTIIYTHSAHDMNVDHRVLNQAVTTACRPQPGQTVQRLLYFEVPCSTTWGGGFHPTYFVDVTGHLPTKLLAFSEYTTEIRDYPHPRSRLGIEELAHWRGVSVGVECAEAFEVGRIVA